MPESPKRIRMLVTKRGSIDGNQIAKYLVGEVYEDLGPLAEAFVRAGWAEEIFGDAPELEEASPQAAVKRRVSK